jgi:type I restriction enzyme, R subunit
MDPSLLYESPFTDYSPLGVEGVFSSPQVGALLAALDGIRQTAAA